MSPNRIGKLKVGRSRTFTVTAQETMAVWQEVGASIRARTTAGKITPRRATSRKGHPAKFRLTRTRGSTFGFVTFTAATRKYGTAKRNISWGKVRLARTLTGTLTYVMHDEWRNSNGVILLHRRDQWQVTFTLADRSWKRWFGAARYRLTTGSWQAEEELRAPGEVCAGKGAGQAATGTVRYDWLGTHTSSGAGLYWLDLSSTDRYVTECTHHSTDRAPSFTLGFDPATNGVHPDHLKGSRRVQHTGPSPTSNSYEVWTWDLREP